jgi:hypothetical protein
VMALVAHYDLELHQIDVKTVFLNSDLQENVYMAQLKILSWKARRTWDANLRNLFMG